MVFPLLQGSARDGHPPTRAVRRTTVLLALLGAAVVLLAWTAALNQSAFEHQSAINAAMAQNRSHAMMLQQYVTRTLDAANIACLHITELHAKGRPFALRADGRPDYIDGPIAHNPAFLGLSVADARGEVVATTVPRSAPMGNVRDHPAFVVHVARDTGRLFVSRPRRSRTLGRDTLWLSRRISNADGSFAGVVAINMDPAQLSAIFGEATHGRSEAAWVLGTDGYIRSRRTSGAPTSGEDVRDSDLFNRIRRAPQDDYLAAGTIDPRPRIISYRRVEGYPLYVTFSVRQDEALRAANLRSDLFFLGAALVTLIVAGVGAVLVVVSRRRELRAAELGLANSRLQEAQRIARVGDWSYDFPTNQIIWSPPLYEMYERDPALGAPLLQELKTVLDPESRLVHDEAIAAMAAGGPAANWEVSMTLPSGRRAHHSVSAVPTRDAQGTLIGLHGTTQDITERKKLEALQNDLAHLSRIGEMNALTATLSHELNQPLTAASNYLGTARHLAAQLPEAEGDPILDALREAHAQVARTGTIIQRMRNLVSKGAISRSVASIDEVLEEAVAIVSITGVCRGPVRIVPSEREILVEVDSVQIQQVVLNLVRNACEAQRGLDVPPPRIEVGDSKGDEVIVRVIDQGPGMPESLRARLFEPFTSSKPGGLGLGLSISRTIIEAHGGALKAQNNPAGGATLSFTLPVYARHARDSLARAAND